MPPCFYLVCSFLVCKWSTVLFTITATRFQFISTLPERENQNESRVIWIRLYFKPGPVKLVFFAKFSFRIIQNVIQILSEITEWSLAKYIASFFQSFHIFITKTCRGSLESNCKVFQISGSFPSFLIFYFPFRVIFNWKK